MVLGDVRVLWVDKNAERETSGAKESTEGLNAANTANRESFIAGFLQSNSRGWG